MNKTVTDWSFKFDFAKERCGICSYRNKTISLSRYFIGNASLSQVLNTIRHEIAHALTPGAGHGKEWRQLAIRMGCDGKTCSDIKSFSNPSWFLKCPCGKVNYPRHRRSKVSNKMCKYCHGTLTFISAKS